jgi:hypothetical protein
VIVIRGELEAMVAPREGKTKIGCMHMLDWFNQSISRMLGLLRRESA